MDCDGHVRKNSLGQNVYKRNAKVSEKLTLTLALAIQKCFEGVSICYTKRNAKTVIKGRIVNQRNSYEITYSEDQNKSSKFECNDNYISYNLTKSKSFIENGINDVYNIEVEEDNSYIVNNLIVHNCQGFSFMGNQLNFNDHRSKLFFEYVRLLHECKPSYFLLENVKMKKEYEDIISNELGVKPKKINSAKVSAQLRSRYYWTNIPFIDYIDDNNIELNDILEYGHSERTKAVTLLASYSEKNNSKSCVNHYKNRSVGQLIIDNTQETGFRKLTVKECCRLQTVPEDYFVNVDGVNEKEKYRQLGNGWTVDVIVHLLSPLKFMQENNFTCR